MSDITPFAPIINDNDPVAIDAMDVSQWYEDETQYVTIDNLSSNRDSVLPWMLAQGWIVTDITTRKITNDGVVTRDDTIYTLTRKKFKAEQALTALINQSTEAYNKGRELNDTRYDDIVAAYQLYLSNSETSMGSSKDELEAYISIAESLISTTMAGDQTAYATELDGVLTDISTGYTARASQITTDIDAAKSEVDASVSAGMFNSTVATSIKADLTLKESLAKNLLTGEYADKKLNVANLKYQAKQAVNDKLLAARDRFYALRDAGRMGRLELQGKVVLAMLNFMERREDGYPDLNSINQMAVQFGSANSAEVAP